MLRRGGSGGGSSGGSHECLAAFPPAPGVRRSTRPGVSQLSRLFRFALSGRALSIDGASSLTPPTPRSRPEPSTARVATASSATAAPSRGLPDRRTAPLFLCVCWKSPSSVERARARFVRRESPNAKSWRLFLAFFLLSCFLPPPPLMCGLKARAFREKKSWRGAQAGPRFDRRGPLLTLQPL